MWTLILRRLLFLPVILLVISVATYALMQLSGGDFFHKLEEDPNVRADYVMGLRRDVGKAIAIAPESRAALGEITVPGKEGAPARTFSFDDEGVLLAGGEPVDPQTVQGMLRRFEHDGATWSVTDTGAVYRFVGPVRGYFQWLSRALRFEFGESFTHKRPVVSVIAERLANTLLLSLAALLIAWGLAIPLGVWSGVRPNSWIDHVCGAVAYFGLSVPSVFLAILAVLFAFTTGWFPTGGIRDTIRWDDMGWGARILDVAHHLILPASVVGITSLAGYMRQMRGQMVETMSADYVRTARAKGLSHNSVIFKHALRNAINPLVTLLGFSIAGLLSGSFLVEVVMNWPGLARVVVDAVFGKDEPVVMAATLMTAVLLVVGNLVADILLGLVDPRIRSN